MASSLVAHEQSDRIIGRLGEMRRFSAGMVLAEAGTPIKNVFLVRSGLVSIVVPLQDGHAVEVAMAGAGLLLGGRCLYEHQTWLNAAVAQIEGSSLDIPLAEFAAAARSHAFLRTLAFQSEQHILAQAQQAAACNARHRVEQRLCTWLLRARELGGVDDLPFTQEFVASMLGAQRAGVSCAAGGLERAGLVEHRRGHIKIIDAIGMETRACECFRAVHDRTRRVDGAAAPAVAL